MILVAGDIMLDVLLLSALRAEEQSRGVLLRPGGSAANTAAWLGHLGCTVRFAGCAGDDEIGAMLTRELTGHGVQTAIRQVRGNETGAVAVEIGDGGERVMRSARGANEALSPDDLAEAAGPGLVAVHLTGYALLGPYGFDILIRAADLARSAGALLSFDPSSCGVIGRVGRAELLETLQRCGVDLLLPNCPEACELAETEKVEDAAPVLSKVVPAVIVKDASAGCVWRDGRATERVPTEALTPLDSTGAGDAFNAGALSVLVQGGSLTEACALGNQVAGRAITAYGGRPPLQ